MSNTKSNVSTGRPKVSGAVYVGATSETLPTDATTALAAGFTCLGYCSEDGLTNTTTIDSDNVKAWGGDIVHVLEEGKEDTFEVTFIEMMNVDVLKEVYGSSNVSGTLAAGITVAVGLEELEARAWVVDMILKGDVLKRIVIPKGTITSIGEISYTDDDLVGYAVTITAEADDDGNYHYEYIQASAT